MIPPPLSACGCQGDRLRKKDLIFKIAVLILNSRSKEAIASLRQKEVVG